MVKNTPANAGDCGLIPGWEDPLGEGHSNPLQYSCLEIPTARGAWWATIHGVTTSQIWLSDSAHIHRNKRMKGRKKGTSLLSLQGMGSFRAPPPPPPLSVSESFRHLPNTMPLSLLLSWNALPSPICLAARQAYCSTIRSLLPHTHSSLRFARINLPSCLPFLWA